MFLLFSEFQKKMFFMMTSLNRKMDNLAAICSRVKINDDTDILYEEQDIINTLEEFSKFEESLLNKSNYSKLVSIWDTEYFCCLVQPIL